MLEPQTTPKKFRKKPVEIEAFQLTHDVAVSNLIDQLPLPWGLSITNANFHPQRREVTSFKLFIETLEGVMEAKQDDWIIKGVKDEIYPCKPDIFEATYDKA